MMALTERLMKSWIWLTWRAESPPASETTTVTPLAAASALTACLIWLKKSACRLATASPMVIFLPPPAASELLPRLQAASEMVVKAATEKASALRGFMVSLRDGGDCEGDGHAARRRRTSTMTARAM